MLVSRLPLASGNPHWCEYLTYIAVYSSEHLFTPYFFFLQQLVSYGQGVELDELGMEGPADYEDVNVTSDICGHYLDHLKRVKIVHYSGCPKKMELIKLLLEKAIILESMINKGVSNIYLCCPRYITQCDHEANRRKVLSINLRNGRLSFPCCIYWCELVSSWWCLDAPSSRPSLSHVPVCVISLKTQQRIRYTVTCSCS